jgi:hypothetical protein
MGWNDHFLDAGEDEKEEAMTHEEKELATKITYMLLEAQRGDPNGGKAYQITKMFEDYKRIVSKALASAEKKAYEKGREDEKKRLRSIYVDGLLERLKESK